MGTETDSFFTVSQDQGYTLVEFRTESLMNPVELERVGRGLYRLVDVEHRHQVLLDFTGVKYLSSQAVGIILTMNKKLSQFQGGRLVLCGVGPQLLQLLKITRLDQVLKIVAARKDAPAVKA